MTPAKELRGPAPARPPAPHRRHLHPRLPLARVDGLDGGHLPLADHPRPRRPQPRRDRPPHLPRPPARPRRPALRRGRRRRVVAPRDPERVVHRPRPLHVVVCRRVGSRAHRDLERPCRRALPGPVGRPARRGAASGAARAAGRRRPVRRADRDHDRRGDHARRHDGARPPPVARLVDRPRQRRGRRRPPPGRRRQPRAGVGHRPLRPERSGRGRRRLRSRRR